MVVDTKTFFKFLSPKMISKAIQTFDRATTIVVSSCWVAAVVMTIIAAYTVTLSVSTRRAADAAAAIEPNLPKIDHRPMDVKTAQKVFERLQHRFPDISITVKGQSLLVSSSDGSKFRQWLTAISYIDTVSPEFHWTIQDFCVGKCGGSDLMHATLNGERVSFSAPAGDSKN